MPLPSPSAEAQNLPRAITNFRRQKPQLANRRQLIWHDVSPEVRGAGRDSRSRFPSPALSANRHVRSVTAHWRICQESEQLAIGAESRGPYYFRGELRLRADERFSQFPQGRPEEA